MEKPTPIRKPRARKPERDAPLEEKIRAHATLDMPKTYTELVALTGAPMAAIAAAVRSIARDAGYKDADVPAFIRTEEDATVTAYDANGEAIDVRVPRGDPAAIGVQPELPAMPPRYELWPVFDGLKVLGVHLAFAGTIDITKDPLLADKLKIGNRIRFILEGEITGRSFKKAAGKAGQPTALMGVATVSAVDVSPIPMAQVTADTLEPTEANPGECGFAWRGANGDLYNCPQEPYHDGPHSSGRAILGELSAEEQAEAEERASVLTEALALAQESNDAQEAADIAAMDGE